MSFPVGVQTVTLTAGAAGYRTLDGEPYQGPIRLTPSVPRVVSVEHGVIALGVINITVGASGQFTEDPDVLANDADGFSPSGWTYRVDEEFTNAPGRAYSILLPAAVPTVALSSLIEVEPSDGEVVWQPAGGTPASTVVSETDYGQAATAGAATAYSRGDHTHGTPAAPTTGTTAGTYAAGNDGRIAGAAQKSQNLADLADAATARTSLGLGTAAVQNTSAFDASGVAASAVSGHAGATDPHADRAYTDTQVATRVPTSRQITAGAGLTGGGSLAADRSLAVNFGTGAGTVAAGDDSRFSQSKPWVFDVTAAAYGAAGDAQVVGDGAMSSGSAVLTSATAAWPSTGIVGKAISVKGAGAAGVTTLITTVASRQSATQITLSAANASGGAVSNAVVIWGTDDTAAIQAATTAAEAYLTAGSTYAQVYFPPRPYIVAGALNNTKSGNGQIAFGPVAVAGVKKILEFRGETDGAAAVRHWQQTVPQFAGSCLISLGVYASTSAQTTNINADGNPGVISGPNEGFGYGASALFSNMQAVVRNLAILTTHSSFGLTYGALNLWGCANAHVENFGYGTAGTVASPSTDYSSPGTFGTGLSVGCLLPAPGNNDHVIAKNISCGGGYTYAMFLTEHAVVDRYMALYCWAGLVVVGTYFGSVGSVHAMKVISASIEACTNELYIMGAGSSGVGPIIDIDQLSTESGTPNIAGQAAHMAAARGVVRWTGLFTESGLTHDNPTGIESVNAQAISPVRAVTGTVTARPIDRVLKADALSAGVTVNLPSAAPNPVTYTIVKVDASGNTVTVDPFSTQTINGAATKVLSAQWESVTLRSDGSNWIAI